MAVVQFINAVSFTQQSDDFVRRLVSVMMFLRRFFLSPLGKALVPSVCLVFQTAFLFFFFLRTPICHTRLVWICTAAHSSSHSALLDGCVALCRYTRTCQTLHYTAQYYSLISSRELPEWFSIFLVFILRHCYSFILRKKLEQQIAAQAYWRRVFVLI